MPVLLDLRLKLLLSVSRSTVTIHSGTLKLNTETGRYNNADKANHLCICCNMNVIEDDCNFILVCPAYRRVQLLPKYYCSWPNCHKLFAYITGLQYICNFEII